MRSLVRRVATLTALSVALGGLTAVTWAPAASAALPASSAVLALPFDGNLTDASPEANPVAVRTGAISYETGVIGQAAVFNGSTALNLGTGTHLQPQDLTASFWYKPSVAMTGEQVFSWSKTTYNADGWYLTSESSTKPLALSIGPSSGQPYKVSVNTTRSTFFPTGEWTHVAVTYDHTTKNVAMYRNGVKQATTIDYAVSGSATGVLGQTSVMKTIGFNGPNYNGAFLRGSLDEWRVHDTVATTTDVVELYQEGVPGFDPAAVAQLDLDAISIPETVNTTLLALQLVGIAGSEISWSTDSLFVSISPEGIATITKMPDTSNTATLTATATYGGSAPVTKTFTFTIPAVNAPSIYLGSTALEDVTLEDEYLRNLESLNADYLLSLDSKKFLFSFYVQAGLTPPTATGYGGWERTTGTRFQGHFFGHYISALSQAYSTEADPAKKTALLAELTEAVEGLSVTQAAYAANNPANAGYVSPFPVSYLPSGSNGLLVPFYNLHKVLAGLLDAYTYAPADVGDEALLVASKFGTWVRNWASAQANPANILNTEYGGMNEALYELFSYTHDPAHKRAAEYFDETVLFQQLANNQDVLNGKHANTTIPKLIGALKRYTVFNDNPDLYDMLTPAEQANLPMYLAAAENFWQIVIDHHTYANGGNSQSEHFHAPDSLHARATTGSATGYGENSTSEGCNEYNMLKLSADLFKVTGDVKYLDYYEDAYINAVVSTASPETAMVTYFEPMTAGYAKVFGHQEDEFWCDHGTGVEKLSMLQSGFYYTDENAVIVAQFRSSTFTDTSHNLVLTQVADVPSSPVVTLTVDALDGDEIAEGTELKLRVPVWVDGEPTLEVNGSVVSATAEDGFITVAVAAGDEIVYTIPATTRVVADATNPNWVAFKYGPVLLGAKVSHERVGESYQAGVLVRMSTADRNVVDSLIVDDAPAWTAGIEQNLVRIADGTTSNGEFPTIQFKLQNTDPASAALVWEPFYSIYDARYTMYVNLVEPDSAAAQNMILARKLIEREAATSIDSLTSFDNNNSEFGKNLQYQNSEVFNWNGSGRHGLNTNPSWFSYDMTVDPAQDTNYLCVKYTYNDAGRQFDVYFNDVFFKKEVITARPSGVPTSVLFYEQCDEIPRAHLDDPLDKVDSLGNPVLDEHGETIPVVRVKFQRNTAYPSFVGGVFGIWIRSALGFDANPDLSALSFDEGTLAPAFDPQTREYTLTVPTGTTEVSMDVAPAAPGGLVKVGTILIDDTQPRRVPLAGETTTLNLTGVAQDHTTTADYTVTIVTADEPVECEVPEFPDVPQSRPFAAEIGWLACTGVTTGYADGNFYPSLSVNRDAMAAFLYRFAGSPAWTPPAVSPFSDVSVSHQFYAEITWLAEQGITTGYVDGTFRPAVPVNRDAMAAFLYRFDGSPEWTPPAVSPFSDVSVSRPFYAEITWLADQQITTGYEDGTFRPVGWVNRDAMAAFLYRFDHR